MIATPETTYAIIENNEVVKLFTGLDLGAWDENVLDAKPIPQGLNVEVGYIYNATTQEFIPPSIESLRNKKLEEIFFCFEREVLQLRANNSELEIESWNTQLMESREFLRDENVNTPLLNKLCEYRNMPKRDLALKVINKHEHYMAFYGKLLAYQQTLKKKIATATTKEQLDAIIYKSPINGD